MLMFVVLSAFIAVSHGSFYLYDLIAQEPVLALANSTAPTLVEFIFYAPDQHTWSICNLTWAGTAQPPSTAKPGSCGNENMTFAFPEGTWKGPSDFRLALWFLYEDDSLGPPPWNINTEYSEVNITAGDQWKCPQAGVCFATPGRPIQAKILTTFA